jgi:hypothetical protein
MSNIHSAAQYNRWQKSQLARFEKWTKKAHSIHNNKFNYDNVVYAHSHDKVNIICPLHGIFSQRACDHTNQKQGCPECSHNFTITPEEFIIRSKQKYQDNFTVISSYNGMTHPITICCKEHGDFTLKAAKTHLKRTGGCPTCLYLGRLNNLKPGNISKMEKLWLDSLNVPKRQEKIVIDAKVFLVDGFNQNTNTIYEYYGSFWHGNPQKYSPNEINIKVGKTFGELYTATIDRENQLKKYYNLITFWGN